MNTLFDWKTWCKTKKEENLNNIRVPHGYKFVFDCFDFTNTQQQQKQKKKTNKIPKKEKRSGDAFQGILL